MYKEAYLLSKYQCRSSCHSKLYRSYGKKLSSIKSIQVLIVDESLLCLESTKWEDLLDDMI